MHTASFTASVLVLAKLALCADEAQLELSHEIRSLPMKVQSALDQWEVVMRIARQPWREVIFVGSGAEGIIAREGALKLKEAAYIHAEGFDVETFLHGPLLGVSPDALVILLRTSDPHGRMNMCAEFLKDIGIAQWSIGPGCDFELPTTTSPLSALPSVVPLQLFAAFSALTRGLDPGCFRKNDQGYANALGKITL
jgi:glucosamine 6-phosphate synthetase-like amidotransferase/phosphosugar isomerase protein